MDVVADLPADAQAAEPVQQGQGLFDDPAVHAQSGTVLDAAAGDERPDVLGADLFAVLVVGAVGVHPVGSVPRVATPAAYQRDGVEQWYQVGDVVAVGAGQCHGQGHAAAVGDQVVLGARPGAVDRARTGFGPPFTVLTDEESTAARDQSNVPTDCKFASSSSCSRGHTPASAQSRSRRQHVMPDPYPSSCGKNSHPDARVEYEQDAAQRLAVIESLTFQIPEAPLDLRQQRFDQLQQLVLDLPRPTPGHTNLPPDTNQPDKRTVKRAALARSRW
ncbi:hypothetical protein C8D88_10876 [Lentzea atacamensis]|uniref:Uncharacterized protein n=1 Tax=Lentzea atacamensis TaxID=531938 RepID=A0A316HWE7_9PSEU|nr:hypothetical protein C8D88_10876 [Lentzea atacamensis]